MRYYHKIALICWLGLSGLGQAALSAVLERVDLPGIKADGSILLPNQWSLRPVGKHVDIGDFPVNIAVYPSGKVAAVLHCGYGPQEIVLVDIASARVTLRLPVDESFYGLAFNRDGSRLFASGAGDEVVHSFKVGERSLSDAQVIRLRQASSKGVPCGLALSASSGKLWVANVMGHQVNEVDLETGKVVWEISLAGTNTGSGEIIVPPSDPNLAAATKRDEAKQMAEKSDEAHPYAVLADEIRERLYVSLWGRSEVAVISLKDHKVTGRWKTDSHPNEMLLSADGKFLFVANANHNTVTILNADTGAAVETLSSSMWPDSPPGSTPNSLALSPDGEHLFVANACNNNIAVFDVEKPGASKSLGFIPVGWYPTSVRVTGDGKYLLVANGKGLTSRSNRHGPQPGRRDPPATVREYIGGLMQGTLAVIELPKRDRFAEQMNKYSINALKCSPRTNSPSLAKNARDDDKNPIPRRVGLSSPIRYCLYIIKENRTYDQVLGDMPQGNGAPELCLFPEAVTPNHHALAREFVLLDNFYVESEVSADGHEWTVGAYATDYVEKTWPMNYGHGKNGKFPYPSEGRFKIAFPSGGYLWDKALEAGVTYRSYGEFVDNPKNPGEPAIATVPSLVGHIDPHYRSWDMDYPDVKRAERFVEELKRFEKEGDMPRLQIMRLPNDHTYGTRVGKPTPRAMVADNDLALGMVIEALSKSKFWSKTAVFVVEDDAQNGPDHVDAHRSIAFVAGPHVKRGFVDSTMYSTSSMLRTMELILGLKPMSQFDASAMPMRSSFTSQRDDRPFLARKVTVDLREKNLATAWGSALSEGMDFAKEDAADDIQLNEVIWRSIKGADRKMPAPVRAAFVRAAEDDDD